MPEIPNRIKSIINDYIKSLRENNIRLRQAVLFGSYVNGRFDEWSDIDIALVSEDFVGVRMDDRNKIRKITLQISSVLQPLPFRPEDFTPDNPFVKEILQTGVKII